MLLQTRRSVRMAPITSNLRVLLTNDDGADSPLLATLIIYLRKMKVDLTVVAPATEQSWTGKRMTPKQKMHLRSINIEGHEAYTFEGSPAGVKVSLIVVVVVVGLHFGGL